MSSSVVDPPIPLSPPLPVCLEYKGHQSYRLLAKVGKSVGRNLIGRIATMAMLLSGSSNVDLMVNLMINKLEHCLNGEFNDHQISNVDLNKASILTFLTVSQISMIMLKFLVDLNGGIFCASTPVDRTQSFF